MNTFPDDLKYTKEHEWARIEGDTITVGITSHAVEQLGDITMVTLPEPGTAVTAGDPFGDIDSVKAVSELYAPTNGEVTARNEELDNQPELINEDPYDRGWMVKIKVPDAAALQDLLDAESYRAFVTESGA